MTQIWSTLLRVRLHTHTHTHTSISQFLSENLILEKLDLAGKVADDTGTETGIETSLHGTETDRHGTQTGEHGLETTPPAKRHRSSEHDISVELF